MYMYDNSIIVSVPPKQVEIVQLASRMGTQAAARVATQAYATGYSTAFTRQSLARWETVYPIALRKAGYLVAGYMRELRQARAKQAPIPPFTERPGQGRSEDLECLMAVFGRYIRVSGGNGRPNGHVHGGGRTRTLTA